MNEKLIPNSTQIPNLILDLLLPKLPEAESKCMLYIARRTYGFHVEEDRISFSQFIKGIKTSRGKILDYGTGLARASVNEGLKNLIKAEAIFVRKDTKGNYYRINLDMAVDKVVQKVNQFRKQTRIGSESRPKQVHLLNLQKKGNIGNKVITANFKNLEKLNELKAGLAKKMEMATPQERTADQEEAMGQMRPSGIRF